MFDKLSNVVFIFAIIILLIFGLFILLFVFYRKKKNKQLKEETDYRGIKVEDSIGLVPIDDIRDDMIIDEDGKRFTAVILCSGSDFFYKPTDEKLRLQDNYIGFWHALRGDISFRQAAEAVNLDHTIKRYEDAHHKLESEHYILSNDYRALREQYDTLEAEGKGRDQRLEKQLLDLQKRIKSLEYRMIHIEDQLGLANRMVGPSAEVQKNVLMYVYSWSEPGGLQGTGLQGEALFNRAKKELNDLTKAFTEQLKNCDVTCVRADTNDLIDLFRRQTHPFSGNTFNTSDLLKLTSWSDDVVDTNTFEKAKGAYVTGLAEDMMIGGLNGTL